MSNCNSDNYIKINNDYYHVGFKLKLFLTMLIDAGVDDTVLAKMYQILYWSASLDTCEDVYRVTSTTTKFRLSKDSSIENIFIDNKAIATHLLS